MAQNYQLPQKSFYLLIGIVLILGIFFRFVNIEQKLFHGDECITTVRSTGFKHKEVNDLVPKDRVIIPEEIKRFQRVNGSGKNFINTIEATADKAPQHTPLYFVLTRFWLQLFGDSAIAMRMLTALFSLLAFPAAYWLCIELFQSTTVGLMTVALISVSPVHISQAQNSRPYSLWILTVLLSSAALLRAIRTNQKFNWVIYGVTLLLSIYTFLFSIFVLIAHTIYVFIIEKFRKTKILLNYLLTSLLAVLSFTPWIFVIITNFQTADKMTSWTAKSVSFLGLTGAWHKNLTDIFIYWHSDLNNKFFISVGAFNVYFGTPLLILTLFSFYFLWKHTPKRVWLFIYTLTGVSAFGLILPDLILGGLRSALGRYLYPSVLGIQITVAYLLATKINAKPFNTVSVKIWKIITILLISCGVLSSTLSSQTETWDGSNDFIIQSSRIINQAPHPVVVSDDDIIFGVMPLNFRLGNHVRLILVSDPTKTDISKSFSDVFLWNPSEKLRSQLQEKQQVQLKPVLKAPDGSGTIWENPSPSILWKLEK